jgi:hypothetical protein
METSECIGCKVTKPKSNFNFKNNTNQVQSYCRSCQKIKNKQYRDKQKIKSH